MKIKYLKPHGGHVVDDEAEVKDRLAGYLIKVGVATLPMPTNEEVEKKLTKKLKATKKKKK